MLHTKKNLCLEKKGCSMPCNGWNGYHHHQSKQEPHHSFFYFYYFIWTCCEAHLFAVWHHAWSFFLQKKIYLVPSLVEDGASSCEYQKKYYEEEEIFFITDWVTKKRKRGEYSFFGGRKYFHSVPGRFYADDEIKRHVQRNVAELVIIYFL